MIFFDVLYLRMTTKGRQVARAGLAEPPPEGTLPNESRLPPGTLRRWHWRALAQAYAAGGEGLTSDIAGDYGRIGWRTWLRLRDYQNKAGGFGGLVEERVAGMRPGPFNPGQEHRLFVTADGRRFYEERREEYRQRYPEVDAPDPRGAARKGDPEAS